MVPQRAQGFYDVEQISKRLALMTTPVKEIETGPDVELGIAGDMSTGAARGGSCRV
jgi:hypothetical protein